MAETDALPTAGTDTPSAPQSPPDLNEAALATFAKDDDATKYIEARTGNGEIDTEAEPEKPNPIEEALEEARRRTREARETDQQLDQELTQAEQEWNQQQQQEQAAQQQYANQLSYHEARGRVMERAEQLKRTDPQRHKTIADNLTFLESVLSPEQNQALEAALVFNTDAAWRLGEVLTDDNAGINGTPMSFADKVELIRAATPQEIWQGAVQGAANLRQEAIIQKRIFEDRMQRGRIISSAPPPMSNPRGGGVNPPRDIYKTAEKSDASDYIKMRRAQNARAERD